MSFLSFRSPPLNLEMLWNVVECVPHLSRRQEEESLTAALALSVAGTGEEGEEKEDSPPSSTDLLLDLDTST